MATINDVKVELLEKIHETQNTISKDVAEINVTLERQATSLEYHIKRTNLLEEQMNRVNKHVNHVEGIFKVFGAFAALAGIAKVVIEVIKLSR